MNSQSRLLSGCCLLGQKKSIGQVLNLVMQVDEAARHRARRKNSSADGSAGILNP